MATIASQALVRILPRTRYDLGELRDGVLRLPVAQHVDIVGFERATLQVRVYAGTVPAGASLQVQLADDGFDPNDPAAVPLQTSTPDGGAIGALTIPEGTVFPFYQSVSTAVPGVLSRYLAVVLDVTGGAEGGPVVEIGLDLVLTGGSVGAKIHQPSTYLGYAAEATEVFEPVEPVEALLADDASSEPFLAGSAIEGLVTRLSSTVREALARGGLDVAAPDGGYPRFGNVNVGINDPGSRPDVGEARLATVLSSAIRDALARGGLDVATPDGGYARFGNVNVGIEGHPPEHEVGEEKLAAVLADTIREAVRRGDLDVATPGGGYARFGNVNVGIDGEIRPVDLRSDPGPQQDG